MHKILLLVLALSSFGIASAQVVEPDPDQEQELEKIAEKTDAIPEDDGIWQDRIAWKRHPIRLNEAEEEDLEALDLLTPIQVSQFFVYRALLGGLISIYELQSIPSWDLETIRKILPYVTVGEPIISSARFGNRWKKGDQGLLLRAGQVLEKSKGYDPARDSSASHYLGSPQKLFFRYTYRYRSLLQFGLLGDKDAGEQFFRGSQPYGFDFYSFHFFSRKMGILKALAIGDFSVNMGQGLIQWQGLASTKTADVMAIKRQSPVLRPYHSAGEFNFHRGLGISFEKKPWEATVFISTRKISSNLVTDTLYIDRENQVSSFEGSGYHRTPGEIEDRNNTKQIAAGINLGLSIRNFHFGLNGITYQFSNAIKKQDEPYNLFAISGKSWANAGIDYSYTYRNAHLFGEAAMDKNFHRAFVQGACIALGRYMDAALLYRNISPAYQALYANAFTENTAPVNEEGFYAGLVIRPMVGWQINLYYDIYRFPWLKYQVNGPGNGRDFFIQLLYKPGKTWSISSRYKNEAKSANSATVVRSIIALSMIPRQEWRTEFAVSASKSLQIRTRVDVLWYDKYGPRPIHGFLEFVDLLYKAHQRPIGGNLRIQYFETDGYAARIYAFESDLLYSYSLPAFYNRGINYYINFHAKCNQLFKPRVQKKPELEFWVKWAQTIYSGKPGIGTGLDFISGHTKSELKFQILVDW